LNFKEGIDFVIFRENTEDLYSGYEFNKIPEAMFQIKGLEKLPRDAAISIKVNTPRGCQRIIKTAFDFARANRRRKFTCVHKANVVRATDGLFLEIFNQVASQYPDIQSDDANIDSLCQWILKNPFNYDVLVAPNLYGDIISDLCAQMTGGLGFGSSGNIGDKYAVFEPTHGSAPKYTGMYKVNPIATILAAKMMLEWIKENEMAAKVERATAAVIRNGKTRTYDMGGSATSLEMAKAVAAELK
jgi:3-isopropylmalate dehydrogenase